MTDKTDTHLEEVESIKELGQANTRTIQVTASQERTIRKAFDRRVVPLVCALYVLSYIDRGNIGNLRDVERHNDLLTHKQATPKLLELRTTWD